MYNIITGCKRSGTSALMFALRQSGIPILGHKYPIRLKNGDIMLDVGSFKPFSGEDRKNTNGYWEISPITDGTGLQKEHQNWGVKGDLVKVMSWVLPLSEPDLVDKIILIVRHPREMLMSRVKCGQINKNDYRMLKIGALSFVQNTLSVLKWAKEHNKELIIIDYNDLVVKPHKLHLACHFLERGDYRIGMKFIRKNINAKWCDLDGNEMKLAINFYQNCMVYDQDTLLKEYNIITIEKMAIELANK